MKFHQKNDNTIAKQHSCQQKKSLRQDREILNAVLIQNKSVGEIARTLTIPISRSAVNHQMQPSNIHKYRSMCWTPMR